MENFKSSQTSWLIWVISILFLGSGIYLVISDVYDSATKVILIPYFIVAIALPLLFSKLESTVYDDHISIKFGIGIIKKKIMITDIEEVTYVENKWWYGWGIRITPHGWLWNIKGKEALQFKIKGKARFFRLGCADMKAMHKAIKAKM
ncbi:MAG: hypothetical protein ABJG68_14655 [Crocinitomicaceae bacterium]